MPYPNEHAARLKDPKQYDEFRRSNNKFGGGIHAIFGIKTKPKRVSELQSIRFDKNKFTVAQAKKWLRDHNYKPIRFEPATGEEKNMPKAKILSISGVIGWDTTAKNVREFLEGAGGKAVEVQISSPGGYVYPGLEMFNALRNYEGHVTTRLMGLAASMASYIAMAGDRVIAEDNSIFMIHNAAGLALGDHKTMRKAATVIEGISNLLAKKYMEKTGKSLAEIKELMDDETFLFGDEIKESGFVDEIAETKKGKDKATAVAFAIAAVTECTIRMKGAENAYEDLEKVAAFLDTGMVVLDGAAPGAWKYCVCSKCSYWEKHTAGKTCKSCPKCGTQMHGSNTKPKGGKSMKTLKGILAIEDVEERNKEIESFFGELFDEDRENMVKEVLKSLGIEKKKEPVNVEALKVNEELVKTVKDLQGQVDTLKVEVKSATEATGVEKDARRLLEIKASLKDGEVFGDIEKMAKMIFSLEKVDSELAKDMEAQFKSGSEKLRAAGIFTEIGSSDEGKEGGSYEKLKKLVDEAVAADPTITPAKAWKDVIRDNPELYKEYLKER